MLETKKVNRIYSLSKNINVNETMITGGNNFNAGNSNINGNALN